MRPEPKGPRSSQAWKVALLTPFLTLGHEAWGSMPTLGHPDHPGPDTLNPKTEGNPKPQTLNPKTEGNPKP